VNKKPQKPKAVLTNQKGQSLVEYLIIVALVAVSTMSVMRVVGQSVQVKFAKIAEALGAETKGEIGHAEVTESQWKKRDLRDFMQGARTKDDQNQQQKSE